MTQYSINDFFLKRFEEESTNLLIDLPSFFSIEVITDYVNQLLQIPLSEYLSYLKNNPNNKEVTSKDITQLSSIQDCTINMCKMLYDNQNKGLILTDIAKYLHGDNDYKDNDVALTKYGENQVKTACQLGLTIYVNNRWYLTCIGYIFPSLSEEQRNKLLCLSLLRDPFYSKIIVDLCQHDVLLPRYMTILSETTIKRRTSSCIRLLNFFTNQCELENIRIHDIIPK